ncbi:MAG TPA: hypothetical protein VNR61_18320 [Niallia sp.]|nr:hypothetical protein [Niallia sp.]
MQKLFSVIIIGLVGYFLIQKRYRLLNSVLRNPFVRKYAISLLMKIPAIRNSMMSSVFGKSSNTIYQ